MKFDEKQDEFIFESTGRREYSNNGIIGLSPDLCLSEGYDGGFGCDTPEERQELANYMIDLWQKFKDAPSE